MWTRLRQLIGTKQAKGLFGFLLVMQLILAIVVIQNETTPSSRANTSGDSNPAKGSDEPLATPASSGDKTGGSTATATDSKTAGQSSSTTDYAFCYKGTEAAKKDPECAALPDEPPDRPYDYDPRIEKVTWQELERWWPYPLLRDSTLEATGAKEVIFVAGETGGLKSNPKKETAGFTIFYQYPPRTADRFGYYKILDGGGIAVRATFDPPGKGYTPALPRRPIEVRGHPAWLYELRKPKANVDWRRVLWNEPQSNGGTIQWEIGDNPLRREESALIQFINDLDEE